MEARLLSAVAASIVKVKRDQEYINNHAKQSKDSQKQIISDLSENAVNQDFNLEPEPPDEENTTSPVIKTRVKLPENT